jgi:tRNA A-37 threonylcarbamoyl transferase component Bud32
MECLDDNVVSEFVAGSLPPSAVSRIEGHLAGCRDCRALVAVLAKDAANDSNVETVERLSPSQMTELPRRMLTIGDRVSRYVVLSTLGTGGMGVVFAAYDPQLDRKVALKLLRSGKQYNSRDAQQRLRREAQAIAQLSHPNVVGVYDVGTTSDGDLYIAMEFVEGDTLKTWLQRWPRTWREIIEVFLQAGKGLVAAHSVGLLHRDFKPDNVLVGGDGRVRVTDFGLARSLMIEEETTKNPNAFTGRPLHSALTATGTVLGTPRYMPPEQLLGPDIDARSDQFSYCVALYEALYGDHPLPGSTAVSMLESGDKALPPPEDSPVPPSIARAVIRGLERDEDKRFPTMSALMTALVPPQPKLTFRVTIAASAAIVIGGASMAAVLSRDDTPIVDPRTREIVEELNLSKARALALEEDVRRLEIAAHDAERGRAKEQERRERTEAELRRKQQELDAERERSQQLENKLARGTRLGLPEARLAAVMSSARRDLEGIFEEWGQRRSEDGRPHTQANLLVRLTVGSDGVGHSCEATGEASVSLRLDVAAALCRVRFPSGPEQLDLHATVAWDNTTKVLTLPAPRIVGRSTPSQTLDVN